MCRYALFSQAWSQYSPMEIWVYLYVFMYRTIKKIGSKNLWQIWQITTICQVTTNGLQFAKDFLPNSLQSLFTEPFNARDFYYMVNIFYSFFHMTTNTQAITCKLPNFLSLKGLKFFILLVVYRVANWWLWQKIL